METRQENLACSANVLTNISSINKIIKKEAVYYRVIKRGFDIVCSLIGILFLIPLIAIAFLGNFFSRDRGPVFFIQKRIGLNGKLFRMYKLRTMVVGADKKLRIYLKEHPEEAKEYEKYKKLNNDPRITKFGKFLRKTSLDEFPQFINVLKGDMSVVGNRPYLLREKEDMGNYFNDIVKTKCGIFSYWAVNGRNDVTFENRLKMEQYYSNHRSLTLDIKILLKAVKVVLFRKGSN